MEYKLPFKEYNKALRENRLLGLKCDKCGSITCPPKMACQECGSLDLDKVELSGRGKVVSFTTHYIAPMGRENEVPYTVVLVELEEGPWLLGNLIDLNPSKMSMDLLGKEVTASGRVYPGDMFTNGPISRPVFSLAE
ncbi:MAG: Zn-ribbon domain-containing OB-fold protein [Syntrophomonadaceae bacterium]|nr:Zn-ribbon domain-containing OB-fold protein [Syntrophomonadaceae bacterium]